MAQKRKAQEAFCGPKVQLSAFAAAKLAKRSLTSSPVPPGEEVDRRVDATPAAALVGAEPYDVHHESVEQFLEEAKTTPPSRTPSRTPTRLSTFRPNELNITKPSDTSLELKLENDETVTIVGEYDLSVKVGIVTVYGAVLRATYDPQRICAPSTHALPQIQARQHDTVVHISSVNAGLRKLDKLSPLFRNIWASGTTSDRSFTPLETSADDPQQRSLSPIEIDRDMDAVHRTLSAKTMVEPRKPRIMAIGAKASGKSTFNRVLCNHFHSWTSIKECQFLDIDPGQPEFSPSGHVSLVEVSGYILGPPLAHSASEQSPRYKTLRSHTIAATSFKDDPEHYRACVLDLARYLDDRYPVIVNACGWVTGIGANMIRDLVEDLNISDVVLMEPLDHNLVQSLYPQNAKWSIHKISRRPPKPSVRTSAEQRAMQTLAYFHSRQMDVNGSLRWSGKSINKIRSWIVSYDEPNAGILAAMSYGQQPDPEFLAEVLDGSFVTINLVEGEEENKLREVIDATPEGLPFVKPDDQGISRTLDPAHSQCVGLGLIRAIDAANKQIHLVTPLQERQIAEIMKKTVVLVRGSFDPPEWAYLEELYKSDSLSTNSSNLERPWVSRKGLVGVEGAVWRLRHPPMASAVAGSR